MVEVSDDSELLRCYADERDEQAFGEIVRRYLPLVYHAAARQLSEESHAAEDVTQKVFTLLARKAAGLSQHGALAGWLHTTTRRVASETRRAEQRRRAREQEAYLMSELNGGPEAADWSRLRPVLDEAIAELGADDREAVLLRFFARLPHARIASQLRVSENAARMRVERALERLERLLARRGITSTSAALSAIFVQHAGAAVPGTLASTVTAAAVRAAHGAASASASGGIVVFMGASKAVWVGAAALLLAVMCGVSVRNLQALMDEEARALAADQRFHARRTEAETLRRNLVALEVENAQLTQQVAEAERARAAAAAARTAAETVAKAAEAWDALAEGRALLERHPALKEAVVAKADALTRFFFLPQLRALGLAPAQIEAFIRTKREEYTIGAPFGPNGLVYALPAGDGMTPDEIEGSLRDLLGEENHRKLDDVHRRGEARMAAFDLAAKLAWTDAPISAAQAEQFQRLLLQHRVSVKQPGKPNFDWQPVMAEAERILSSPQIAMLARVRAEMVERAASVRPMADASGKKRPSG